MARLKNYEVVLVGRTDDARQAPVTLLCRETKRTVKLRIVTVAEEQMPLLKASTHVIVQED